MTTEGGSPSILPLTTTRTLKCRPSPVSVQLRGLRPAATTVTITGTDLVEVQEVKFGNVPASLSSLVEISPTEIEIDAPGHSAGIFAVVVSPRAAPQLTRLPTISPTSRASRDRRQPHQRSGRRRQPSGNHRYEPRQRIQIEFGASIVDMKNSSKIRRDDQGHRAGARSGQSQCPRDDYRRHFFGKFPATNTPI